MNPILASPPAPNRRYGLWLIPLLVIAALVVGLLFSLNRPVPAAVPDTPMPTSPEIEAAYGVRFSHVAMIAGGGMVYLRYVVIDPDRAAAMLSDLNALPQIHNPRNGGHLQLTESLHHRVDLEAGRSYSLIYANAGNILRRGRPGRSATR
jgi:hypothetical protein